MDYILGVWGVFWCWGAALMYKSGWTPFTDQLAERPTHCTDLEVKRRSYLHGLASVLTRVLGITITVKGELASR